MVFQYKVEKKSLLRSNAPQVPFYREEFPSFIKRGEGRFKRLTIERF
jgi:hypothetical protein